MPGGAYVNLEQQKILELLDSQRAKENCCLFKPLFCENVEIAAVRKDANLVELEKCCRTHIFLQNFVLIQPRTSPPKICKIFKECIFEKCIFEKCIFEKCIRRRLQHQRYPGRRVRRPRRLRAEQRRRPALRERGLDPGEGGARTERTAETSESVGWQNFGRMLLVFGCIGTDFCNKICVLQHFSKSIRLSS